MTTPHSRRSGRRENTTNKWRTNDRGRHWRPQDNRER